MRRCCDPTARCAAAASRPSWARRPGGPAPAAVLHEVCRSSALRGGVLAPRSNATAAPQIRPEPRVSWWWHRGCFSRGRSFEPETVNVMAACIFPRRSNLRWQGATLGNTDPHMSERLVIVEDDPIQSDLLADL